MAEQTDSSQPATPWNTGKPVGQKPKFEERHLYRISATRALHLGELQGAGLPALNLDAGLLATLDDCLPRV